MNSIKAIRSGIEMSDMICSSYLSDLTDEEMMLRPHEKCNHTNWQVGHLIASENSMINSCMPGSLPDLPEGFADKYTKETATDNAPESFCNKEELLELHKKQRAATLAALESCSDEDLDKESPEALKSYAPTFGDAFNMQGSHWLMHAGQWVIVRRQIGREPLF